MMMTAGTNIPPTTTRSGRLARTARRATALVFVLGVLTLLALIGLILIARTHTETRRVDVEGRLVSGRAVVGGVVRSIQEVLRADIYGWRNDAGILVPDDVPLDGGAPVREFNPADFGARYGDEPFDAPGAADRWLAAVTPYLLVDMQTGSPTRGRPEPQLISDDPMGPAEWPVLVWHAVSYLGDDVIPPENPAPTYTPFVWPDNTRTVLDPAMQPDRVAYDADALRDLRILQSPPPAPNGDSAYANFPLMFNRPMVPGATTNLTIAQARRIWQSADVQAALDAAGFPGRRFPYFDTNADGELDLYDADGDGVPDSPLSFPVPIHTGDPDHPRALYAAIRIVDHAGMTNVNVASSQAMPGAPATDPLFDERDADFQRRGRRATEISLDDAVHPADAFGRATGLTNYRSGADPVAYDKDVVRRQLVGGPAPTGVNYFLYGLNDEAALRHRGVLVPYSRRNEADAAVNDYRNLDRALRNTLQWSRAINAGGAYVAASGGPNVSARWNRFNAGMVSPADEGQTDANGLGWRWLYQEDQPYALRRHMLTTVNATVEPPIRDLDPSNLPTTGVRFLNDPVPDPMMQYTMAWPTLTSDNRQRIDLNMSDPDNPTSTKVNFIRYVAAAVWTALEDVDSYQGIPVDDPPGATIKRNAFNREWLAWQFAVNLADYRDVDDPNPALDNVPTVLEWDWAQGVESPVYIRGVEQQPFFTEAYVSLITGDAPADTGGPQLESSPDDQPDRWFFAFELFIPPGWTVPIDTLYVRTPGSTTDGSLIALNTFLNVAGLNAGNPGGVMSGGPVDTGEGRFYVFCGDTTHAPPSLAADVPSFYRNNAFDIALDGQGAIELVYSTTGNPTAPDTFVFDIIRPDESGGELADNTASGFGGWAFREPMWQADTFHEFSLLRSTKGWRFTTAHQAYAKGGLLLEPPVGGLPLRRSLGQPNETQDSLDDHVPVSVWPGRVAVGSPFLGFDADPANTPFVAFDSVGELSRMLTLGPVDARLTHPPFLPNATTEPVPVTIGIERILATQATGEFLDDKNAAGRIDFYYARHPDDDDTRPRWTWRLFDFFTTQNPLFDGIDNDGIAGVDNIDEGLNVLNRRAGLININTAPVSVLRTVPWLSLTPDSAAYQQALAAFFGPVQPLGPFEDFTVNPTRFWDLASAIVARRENREVPVRFLSGATGRPELAATVRPRDMAGGPSPGPSLEPGSSGDSTISGPKPFTGIGELAGLIRDIDFTGTGAATRRALFSPDRFTSVTGVILDNHKVNPADPDIGVGPGSVSINSPIAPDFRFRRQTVADGIVDYVPVLPFEEEEIAGGVRGRDVLLARIANQLTTRSDVFTAYIALIDEDGNYVHRSQVTLDRSVCFREGVEPTASARPTLPRILTRTDSSYQDDRR